jgi:hypothetical protein
MEWWGLDSVPRPRGFGLAKILQSIAPAVLQYSQYSITPLLHCPIPRAPFGLLERVMDLGPCLIVILVMSATITKLCPKLILEGTRLTGKTDLAIALNEHPRIVGVRKYRYHSPIISAEWNGFVKSPYGSSLIDFEPKYEVEAISAYRTWLTIFELYRYYSWIIDRFHISTQMWQATHRGIEYKFGWLESRLAALGFRLIFCRRHPDSFAEARQERLKISSNPSQYDDLNLFIREQETMERLVANSKIPTLLLDVTEGTIRERIDYIAGWLEETGGLNAAKSPPNPKTIFKTFTPSAVRSLATA